MSACSSLVYSTLFMNAICFGCFIVCFSHPPSLKLSHRLCPRVSRIDGPIYVVLFCTQLLVGSVISFLSLGGTHLVAPRWRQVRCLCPVQAWCNNLISESREGVVVLRSLHLSHGRPVLHSAMRSPLTPEGQCYHPGGDFSFGSLCGGQGVSLYHQQHITLP